LASGGHSRTTKEKKTKNSPPLSFREKQILDIHVDLESKCIKVRRCRAAENMLLSEACILGFFYFVFVFCFNWCLSGVHGAVVSLLEWSFVKYRDPCKTDG
jgi:hypothetical protein